ncbi:DUF4232 domain-containing protein [Streptomyces nymphaeiformis]|uniref:DUF4232 domain-containing protein n=1 Tax=Streptomyces nymphaeiformis TaxID=2663842 RepID=A0A7W7U4R6_9ACTN|nr:DUF4232 domain-containing protein [Streptomyces nymphaeiformis]MBB4985058.1 hypothetical protein [Streptomyces nymphaeiformis]
MRAARTSWKTYALGAAAVAAFLSSTACGPSATEDGAASPAPSGTASATDSAQPSTAPSPSPSTEAPQPSATTSARPSASATATSSGKAPACGDHDVSIGTSYWAHDSGQHLLITATNVTDKPCTLYNYPFITFGQNTDSPLTPMESPAKAIATIGPKQKAYAGVKLFLGGEKTSGGYKSFGIAYADPSNSEDGSPIDVEFSDEVQFVNVGQNPSVTFWNLDRSEVERFVFKAR